MPEESSEKLTKILVITDYKDTNYLAPDTSKTCKNCSFYLPKEGIGHRGFEADIFGSCTNGKITGGDWWSYKDNSLKPENVVLEKKMKTEIDITSSDILHASTSDYEPERVFLQIGPDFGCIHFKSK